MWIFIIALIIFCVLITIWIFYKLFFLRDPAREIPFGNNIVSPADGVVMRIEKFDNKKNKNLVVKKKHLGCIKTFTSDVSTNGYIISIFMSVWNVHINRAPIAGKVQYSVHTKGKFLKADKINSTFENENTQVLIKDENFKVKVIQIAGIMARRIVSFVKKDENILKGQRIGLIKIGSQVTLILPKTVNIKIKKGEKVFAGTSIIAER
ncbi:MAG: phosphatidylserine decarboxylase [Nanoarchaeota archaeon]|nr:phosphatidylserine decarboxylase [Nanoarchaeota archaeon]MBU1030437.1 phosphatidylserine decarboxylase [Nanoarchaeota archaeon]MBU1849780.1 phosphatidylserine decarboxylase [Nanoarchaeota archaeon]